METGMNEERRQVVSQGREPAASPEHIATLFTFPQRSPTTLPHPSSSCLLPLPAPLPLPSTTSLANHECNPSHLEHRQHAQLRQVCRHALLRRPQLRPGAGLPHPPEAQLQQEGQRVGQLVTGPAGACGVDAGVGVGMAEGSGSKPTPPLTHTSRGT